MQVSDAPLVSGQEEEKGRRQRVEHRAADRPVIWLSVIQ